MEKPNLITTTKCNHKFHTECFTQHKNHSTGTLNCPLCRTELEVLGNAPIGYAEVDDYEPLWIIEPTDLEMWGPPLNENGVMTTELLFTRPGDGHRFVLSSTLSN